MSRAVPSLRVLPYRVAAGAWNMAADEVLLDRAETGVATLRFYGWDRPTLSLGYFQAHGPARAFGDLQALDWVRRPTGGAALVHHHEITYALALPAEREWHPPGVPWLVRFHRLLVEALDHLGATATLCTEERKRGEVLCFLHHTPGDVVQGTDKVAGSAQRKRRGALLQHGGILLSASEHAPQLPGIVRRDGGALAGEAVPVALLARLEAETGWALTEGDWSDGELDAIARLERRYTAAAWNERR